MPTFRQIYEVPKVITTTKIRTTSHAGHSGITVKLKADIEGQISALIRLNLVLSENFSCILLYEVPGAPAMDVLRVNGDHGGHRNSRDEMIDGPHVHVPVDADAPVSSLGRPSFGISLERRCTLLPFAWQEFCRRVNIARHERMASAVNRLHTSASQELINELFDD